MLRVACSIIVIVYTITKDASVSDDIIWDSARDTQSDTSDMVCTRAIGVTGSLPFISTCLIIKE